MSEKKYDPAVESAMNGVMGSIAGVEIGAMFGFPAYKAKGKLTIRLVEEGVIAKVGKNRADALIGQNNISKYEPLEGRVWKDWVLISESNPANYSNHKAVFQDAVKFLGG